MLHLGLNRANGDAGTGHREAGRWPNFPYGNDASRGKIAGFREFEQVVEKGESRGAKSLWQGSGGVPQIQLSPPFLWDGGKRPWISCFSPAC